MQHAAAAIVSAYYVLLEEEQKNNKKKNQRPLLNRVAIVPFSVSSWQKLLNSGDNNGFIVSIGFDMVTFKRIVDCVPTCNSPTGRPTIMDDTDRVGLALVYLRLSCDQLTLCSIFGITRSTYSFLLVVADFRTT